MKKTSRIPPCPAGAAAKPLFGKNHPWLAPLAGYSDLPFRLLCRGYGAAVCETEMVSAKGLFYNTPGSGELLASHSREGPLVVQLFGGEAENLAWAVAKLRAAGYMAFDLNMGCSVRKVMRQGAGAAMLKDWRAALNAARAMLAAAKDDNGQPPAAMGFKLRLGIEPGAAIMPDLALRLEDAGADWLCVHPRYASQGFGGRANWNALRDLASRMAIPLLASGDLFTAQDGLDCLAHTSADGVMYARGALRDPAIFRQHSDLASGRAPRAFAPADLREMIKKHLALARQFPGHGNAFHKTRSLIPRYVHSFPGVGALRAKLCACGDWEELEMAIDDFLIPNMQLLERKCG